MMKTEIILTDFNISNTTTGGHYIERAISAADILKGKANKISLMCGGSTNLKSNSEIREKFDSIYLEPGFNTFHKTEMNCTPTLHDCILNIMQEIRFKYDIPLNIEKINNHSTNTEEKLDLLSNSIFLENFLEKIDSYYCALPEETISLAATILSISEIKTLPEFEEKHVSTRKLLNLWYRLRREEGALTRTFTERILKKYASNHISIVFLTANLDNVFAGINSIKNTNYNCAKISFILHQPNEITERNSYLLRRELSKISSEKLEQISINVASNQFKLMLTSDKFNHIGDNINVVIGPFSTKDMKSQGNLEKYLYPKTIATHHLKGHNTPAWLRETDSASTGPGLKFQNNIYINHLQKNIESKIEKLISSSNYTITYLGDARDEKMFHLYCSLLKNFWDFGFDIKTIHPTYFSNGITEKSREALFKLKQHKKYIENTVEYPAPLSRKKYNQLIRQANLVFNCYDPHEYKFKQSGIFYETLLFGKRSIISPGTSAAVIWGEIINHEISRAHEKIIVQKTMLNKIISTITLKVESSNTKCFAITAQFIDAKQTDINYCSLRIQENKNQNVLEYGTLTLQHTNSGAYILPPCHGNIEIQITAHSNTHNSLEFHSSVEVSLFEVNDEIQNNNLLSLREFTIAPELSKNQNSQDPEVIQFLINSIKRNQTIAHKSIEKFKIKTLKNLNDTTLNLI